MRCHACLTEYKLRHALRIINAFRDHGKDRDPCEWPSCFLASEHLSKYCSKHLIDVDASKNWSFGRSSIIHPERAKLVLRKGLAPPNHQWSSAEIKAFENFVQKYQSGETVNAIVLDREFGRNKVYMAAACDFFTGDEIFDTWLDNEWTGAPDTATLDNYIAINSYSKPNETAQKLQDQSFLRHLIKAKGHERTNALHAKQLVAELEKANIGPETFVFSYANSESVDLERLKKWIDKRLPEGTKNPLPPGSTCIPLVKLLRPNIVNNITEKEAEDLTLRLDTVFPIVFSNVKSLIGLNHQPLADCRQARLLGLQALRYGTGEGPLNELVYATPGTASDQRQRQVNSHFTRTNPAKQEGSK